MRSLARRRRSSRNGERTCSPWLPTTHNTTNCPVPSSPALVFGTRVEAPGNKTYHTLS